MNLLNFAFLDEAAQAPQEGGMPSWVIWVILGVAFVLMIAMTIIPRRKQQKQTQMLMDNLKVGDKVMTIGRIVGVITEVNNADNTVTIQSGEGEHASILVIDKLAVGMVIPPNQPAAAPAKAEEKKEDKKPVIEKTAKENEVAELLRQQKKENQGDAFEEVAEPVVEEVTEEVKAEELATEEVKTEEVKAD